MNKHLLIIQSLYDTFILNKQCIPYSAVTLSPDSTETNTMFDVYVPSKQTMVSNVSHTELYNNVKTYNILVTLISYDDSMNHVNTFFSQTNLGFYLSSVYAECSKLLPLVVQDVVDFVTKRVE